jgi:hypothetical protein
MQRYLETRTISSVAAGTIGADIAQHLSTRQHLGKVVVICDRPVIMISLVRKYWFRLTRTLQRERASTLNAEKILALTHDITHMQRMEFAAKPLSDMPRADVLFLTPDQLHELPTSCFTMYVTTTPNEDQLTQAVAQLPSLSLVVDYTHGPTVRHAALLPKRLLEDVVPEQWRKVEQFFAAHSIDVELLADNFHDADIMNEALDTLLGVSSRFMRVAEEFLEALRVAQPIDMTLKQQHLYETLVTLNRRICALAPDTLSQQFIQALSDDDTLAFHDVGVKTYELAFAV